MNVGALALDVVTDSLAQNMLVAPVVGVVNRNLGGKAAMSSDITEDGDGY